MKIKTALFILKIVHISMIRIFSKDHEAILHKIQLKSELLPIAYRYKDRLTKNYELYRNIIFSNEAKLSHLGHAKFTCRRRKATHPYLPKNWWMSHRNCQCVILTNFFFAKTKAENVDTFCVNKNSDVQSYDLTPLDYFIQFTKS